MNGPTPPLIEPGHIELSPEALIGDGRVMKAIAHHHVASCEGWLDEFLDELGSPADEEQGFG